MNFSNDKAIYIQMAERLCDEILSGQYKEDERIPSVREYAVLLQVNTNTAMKAYDQLAPVWRRNRQHRSQDLHGTSAARTIPQYATVGHHYERHPEGMGKGERKLLVKPCECLSAYVYKYRQNTGRWQEQRARRR